MPQTTFLLTGDAFITRPLPPGGYAGFDAVHNIIASHDVRFNNLEITVHDSEGYPAAQSGGTWAMTSPAVLRDLARFGFNVFNTANNHSLDYSHGGVLKTIENLQKLSLPHCGTGENLEEAAAPVYIQTPNARVAVIGVSVSTRAAECAGHANADLTGRPGINPLRFTTTYTVEKDLYRALEKTAEATGMNAVHNYRVKNGYAKETPEGQLYFDGLLFQLGITNALHTAPMERDVQRVTASIAQARQQADYVVVSLHAHTSAGGKPETPAEFIKLFARRCIDGGADIIAGHGPHELRGIELYRGKPIFYSMGNFIFQYEAVSVQPADAYEAFPGAATVEDIMRRRSKDGTAGYVVMPQIWHSGLFGVTARDGVIEQICVHPIDLHMTAPAGDKGWPELMAGRDGAELMANLANLSKPYGTHMTVSDGVGIVAC